MNTKLTIVAFGVFGIFLSGCSSTKVKQIDSESFLEQAKFVEPIATAFSVTYIGSTHDRAYLEHENYITFFTKKPTKTIYWTELESLPIEVVEKIKTGQSPWIPFDHKKHEKQKSNYEPIDLSNP